ncbi:MAG: hypothetical protein MUO72_16355 [Bacteroidales bacterium]|nr:hypothetical protein [Bacteroidales bacterium]
MRVIFDQTEALSYQTWSDTLLILSCPPHTEGLVDLTFRLNEIIYYNSKESFLYSDKELTELCGEISGTLNNSQNYLLTCPVTVPTDQTLIIEKGVLIIARPDKVNPVSITANGIIKATGTLSDPVRMISIPHYKGIWNGVIIQMPD